MRTTRAQRLMPYAVVLAWAVAGKGDSLDLHGRWGFELDPNDVGLSERWQERTFYDRITLPGSTDEKRCGELNNESTLYRLSRITTYTGPAWYQREIDIPASWSGRRIVLFLERAHWETRAWLNDQPLGMQDSLCVPHIYDLTAAVSPGRHTLTIRVDNRIKHNVGSRAHSITEETQTNWNGIIGEIELRATDPVWIEDLQVFPDVEARQARVRLAAGNITGESMNANVRFTVRSGGLQQFPTIEHEFAITAGGTATEAEIPFGHGVRLWDEFTPVLYDLTASLVAPVDAATCTHSRTVTFGMRQLASEDKHILLNGRKVFLRGTLECCVFPLTGYPSMDVRSWDQIFRIARSYGLNHMRFHSWCPPRAAFQAADAVGFLLQVEAPQWVHDVGKDEPRDAFIAEEIRRILTTYGNHPSFGLMSMGNELRGDLTPVHELIKFNREHDPRRLYTSSAGWGFGPHDDYIVPIKPRGLHGATTDKDFGEIVAEHDVACITHELGQWLVYPNLNEITKYKGVLKARNFEMIRDDLIGRGMHEQARAFVQATGLQMITLYKEEIESQMRTPGVSGFQLLSLTDFPGQGTATVGMLDAFWESKGLIEVREFRRFCGPTVPLLRMSKRVFTTDETFEAQAQIAHYAATDLPRTALSWTLDDEQGRRIGSGGFDQGDILAGGISDLGQIKVSLGKVSAPVKATLAISLSRTNVCNSWDIWIYPKAKEIARPANVAVTSRWDKETRSALADGKRVLLLADADAPMRALPGSFKPPFWSPLFFKQEPATMSILCNPAHPALAKFPTDMHTNWQWYELLNSSRTMILDETPEHLRPIVQVIDNFTRNHKLGNLFDTRVGSGRLLVCSLDLSRDLDSRPVARQMLESLYAYMAGDEFDPTHELPVEVLDRLFSNPPGD